MSAIKYIYLKPKDQREKQVNRENPDFSFIILKNTIEYNAS